MSIDTGKRIGDLIILSQRLIDLLTRENRALRDNRVEEVRASVEQKDELSRAYESRIAGLRDHADAASMAAADPELREQLRELGTQIQTLSAENLMLLNTAMEVNRRVLHGMAEALKSAQPGPGTYSRSGDLAGPQRKSGTRNTPLSLDQSL